MIKYYLIGVGPEIHAGRGVVKGEFIELTDPVKLVQTSQGLAFVPSFIIVPADKVVFRYDYYTEITDQELINKIDESVVSIRAMAAGIIPPDGKNVNKIIKPTNK